MSAWKRALWDETYTIEQTPETVTYVKGGVKANDKNVEISFKIGRAHV